MKKIALLLVIFIGFSAFCQNNYQLSKKELRDIGPVARSYGEVFMISKGIWGSPRMVTIAVRRNDYGYHFSTLHFDKKRKLVQEIRYSLDPELYEPENKQKLNEVIGRISDGKLRYQQLGGPVVEYGEYSY